MVLVKSIYILKYKFTKFTNIISYFIEFKIIKMIFKEKIIIRLASLS